MPVLIRRCGGLGTEDPVVGDGGGSARGVRPNAAGGGAPSSSGGRNPGAGCADVGGGCTAGKPLPVLGPRTGGGRVGAVGGGGTTGRGEGGAGAGGGDTGAPGWVAGPRTGGGGAGIGGRAGAGPPGSVTGPNMPGGRRPVGSPGEPWSGLCGARRLNSSVIRAANRGSSPNIRTRIASTADRAAGSPSARSSRVNGEMPASLRCARRTRQMSATIRSSADGPPPRLRNWSATSSRAAARRRGSISASDQPLMPVASA